MSTMVLSAFLAVAMVRVVINTSLVVTRVLVSLCFHQMEKDAALSRPLRVFLVSFRKGPGFDSCSRSRLVPNFSRHSVSNLNGEVPRGRCSLLNYCATTSAPLTSEMKLAEERNG